jgi:hypothetical protein
MKGTIRYCVAQSGSSQISEKPFEIKRFGHSKDEAEEESGLASPIIIKLNIFSRATPTEGSFDPKAYPCGLPAIVEATPQALQSTTR